MLEFSVGKRMPTRRHEGCRSIVPNHTCAALLEYCGAKKNLILVRAPDGLTLDRITWPNGGIKRKISWSAAVYLACMIMSPGGHSSSPTFAGTIQKLDKAENRLRRPAMGREDIVVLGQAYPRADMSHYLTILF